MTPIHIIYETQRHTDQIILNNINLEDLFHRFTNTAEISKHSILLSAMAGCVLDKMFNGNFDE